MKNEELEALVAGLLPPVGSVSPLEDRYKPHECLGIYLQPHTESLSFELPGLLIGQFGMAPYGQIVTLLDGFPKKTPPGAIVVGEWKELAAHYPELLPPSTQPGQDDGYFMHMGRFCLIAGGALSGCLYGAQTMVQFLSQTEDDLPGLRLADAPQLPYRAIAYDLRDQIPDSDGVLKSIGLLNSFKGNRIHLLLHPTQPVCEQPDVGAFDQEDAQELSLCSQEYGVALVPWADVLSEIRAGRLTVDGAVDVCMQMVAAFSPVAVGIGGFTDGDAEAFRTGALLRALDQCLPKHMAVYAHARAVREGELSACPRTVRIWDDADLNPHRGGAAACCLSVDGGSCGFAGLSIHDRARRIDRVHALRSAHVDEIVYRMFHLRGGRLWEHEIFSAMVSVAVGWCPSLGASLAAARFARLAYADASAPYMALADDLAQAIPSALRDDVSLQAGAFGYPLSAAAVGRLAQVPWEQVQAAIPPLLERLKRLRDDASRNTDLLEHAEIPLLAVAFLGDRCRIGQQALDDYETARGGNPKALAAAAVRVDALNGRVGEWIRRLTGINKQQGICRNEVLQLQEYQRKLGRISRSLRGLAGKPGLPDAADVGLSGLWG